MKIMEQFHYHEVRNLNEHSFWSNLDILDIQFTIKTSKKVIR